MKLSSLQEHIFSSNRYNPIACCAHKHSFGSSETHCHKKLSQWFYIICLIYLLAPASLVKNPAGQGEHSDV